MAWNEYELRKKILELFDCDREEQLDLKNNHLFDEYEEIEEEKEIDEDEDTRE